MTKYPLNSEFKITKDLSPLLYKREDYVYLLHGNQNTVISNKSICEIQNTFESERKELIYFPKILEVLTPEIIAYNYPGVTIDSNKSAIEIMQKALHIIDINSNENEYIFIRYSAIDRCFIGYTVAVENIGTLNYESEGYLKLISEKDSEFLSDVRWCINSSFDDSCAFEITKPTSDHQFTSEQNELLDKAIEAVSKLQLSGVPYDVIKKLLKPKIKLSKIVITKRYKILLPDYDKEIKMGPLPKTIFLFFLKHNQEFMFTDLMDYKDELMRIYSKVSNRDDLNLMKQSIERLVDPLDNSICEKCTAVRTAFMEQMAYDIARNYFIEGKQGMPKQIRLDRNLVEWEGGEL